MDVNKKSLPTMLPTRHSFLLFLATLYSSQNGRSLLSPPYVLFAQMSQASTAVASA